MYIIHITCTTIEKKEEKILMIHIVTWFIKKFHLFLETREKRVKDNVTKRMQKKKMELFLLFRSYCAIYKREETKLE
jgi:hypothetical protein